MDAVTFLKPTFWSLREDVQSFLDALEEDARDRAETKRLRNIRDQILRASMKWWKFGLDAPTYRPDGLVHEEMFFNMSLTKNRNRLLNLIAVIDSEVPPASITLDIQFLNEIRNNGKNKKIQT